MNKVFLKFFKKESFDEICTGMFSDILDKMDYKNQVLTNWEVMTRWRIPPENWCG